VILGESFNQDKLIGFAGIWIGLAIFTYSLISSKKLNPNTV
jgi:EamA domain-containing membrane protein RarD